jgi:hypothetical protein
MTERQGPELTVHARGKRMDEEDVGPEARLEAWAQLRATPQRGESADDVKLDDVLGDPLAVELIAATSTTIEGGGVKDGTNVVAGIGDYASTLRAWRQQIAAHAERDRAAEHTDDRPDRANDGPSPPLPAPAVNWLPIGPTAVRRGQVAGNPPVSGRTSDLAIAPGGLRAYAATANGGVWRTDDGGATWTSTMDGWDLDPATLDVDSLACGAIAIDPAHPDRVYVGTGEGESSQYFFGVFGVVYSYAGVGPLRSDNAGGTWVVEPVAAGSASLLQQAFYALAVDPQNREHVLGATTAGLYRREPNGTGGYRWRNVRAGACTSVVVARTGGVTRWFAAMAGGTLLTSTNGNTWSALGTGYPSPARVSLAVQPGNIAVVYAFSDAGLHRWDAGANTWRVVSGAPVGDAYRCAVAVDPSNVNRVYLGTLGVSRGIVTSTGSGPSLAYNVAITSIGGQVHADLHRLCIRDGVPDELWAACDGGVYRSTNASGAAAFASLNVGLATITCTYLAQHPSQPALVFVGAQDNGQLRYTGEEAWLHSADGDGGACVVNWANAYKVISSYVNGSLRRTTDGGSAPGSWVDATPSGQTGALFYPPLVGTPVSGTASDADILAMGASQTFFSSTFGSSWSTPDAASLGQISALAFANATRLYAGTTGGSVYRYTRAGTTWSAGTLIGAVGGAAAFGLAPIITDIAVDPADLTGASFYVCLGGSGDWRRVWHYDGTSWANRSGPSAGSLSSLLAVHFNALAADPAHVGHLYAGADIGIWKTTDAGAHWAPYEQGLPDAGVTDLLLDANRRLLRAATYGRGVYEREIDAATLPGVRLYVRDTALDLGRWPTVDGLADPEAAGSFVRHWNSPNIKVDVPTSAGTYQTPTTGIDFFQFVDKIVDGSGGVATRDPSTGTVVNRVYVEVHNRGSTPANNVRVMLLLTDASTALPSLPSGYATNVASGTVISTTQWRTVGFRTINDLRVGTPKVVEFDLPSTMLPPPSSLPGHSHYCLLALVHSPNDPFTSTQTDVNTLTVNNSHVAQKNLHIVAYTGPVPPGPLPPMMGSITINGGERAIDLLIGTGTLTGVLTLLLPEEIRWEEEQIVDGRLVDPERYRDVLDRSAEVATKLFDASLCDPTWAKAAVARAERLASGRAVQFRARGKPAVVGLRRLILEKGETVAFVVEPEPTSGAQARIGERWTFDVIEVASDKRRIIGASTYQVCVTQPADQEQELPLDCQVEPTQDGRGYQLQIRRLDGGDARALEVVLYYFTADGPTDDPQVLSSDKDGRLFQTTIPRHTGGLVRRVCVVARQGDREGRRTLELP